MEEIKEARILLNKSMKGLLTLIGEIMSIGTP